MATGTARKSEFIEIRRRVRWPRVSPAEQEPGFAFADSLLTGKPFAKRGPTEIDDENAIALCDGVIDLVGAYFNVSTRELRRPGRTGLEAAQVRQIAMYVAHVVLQLTMRQVGMGFQRDRTTVLHACHLIEDLRDEIAFDRMVGHVERVVAAAFQVELEV